MAFDPHSIFGYSTVATVVSQSGTTLVITVQPGDGALFQLNQQVTLGPANIQTTLANGMIGRVTGVSTDQLTIDYSSANREGSNVRSVLVGDAMQNGITPKIFGDIETPLLALSDFVVSGLTAPTSVSLSTTIAAGVIWIGKKRIAVSSDGGHTCTASQDTYVDVDNAGSYHYSGVSNGSAAPAITANSIRIAKIVTNGTAVTSVFQSGRDSLGNLIYPAYPYMPTVNTTARCRVYLTSGMSTQPNNTEFKVTFDTIDSDPGNNFDVVTNHRFTAPVEGHYRISGCASMPDGQGISGGRWANEIRINGVNARFSIAHLSNVNGIAIPVTGTFHLKVGDYVELYAYNLTGGSAGVAGGAIYTYLDIDLISV